MLLLIISLGFEDARADHLAFGRDTWHAQVVRVLAENLLLDVRYALRVLRTSPAFTVVALLTLMLGIGANIVVFGVLNAILLQPPGVRDPQSLYQMRHKAWASGRLLTHSYPAFEDYRRRNAAFSDLAGIFGYAQGTLRWGNSVIHLSGHAVSGNYFDLLGVQPEAGRFFHAKDEHGPDSAPYLVLSDAVWRSVFQADRSVVGTTVTLDKQPFTVLGVAPPQFHGTERFAWPDYWMPIVDLGREFLESRAKTVVTVIGRLKPTVTPQQATENLNAISAELARDYPRSDDGQALRLVHPGLYGDEGDVIRGFLISVNVLALLVLVAACANLASLFAARTADRSRELALRVALGSSGQRLVSQLLTEALLVSVMGGAAGLLGAKVLLGVLNRWPPAAEAHLAANMDARVYLAGLALTLGSALLFGMVPARQAWQSNPLHALKGGAGDGLYVRKFALRDFLLGAQIAICTLLVTASLVAVRGMQRALHEPLGFQPQGAMLVDLDLDQEGKAGDAAVERDVIAAVRSIPGMTAAGTVNKTPFTGGIRGNPIFRPGTTELTLKNSALASYVFEMSPGYLEAAATRLLSGRDVTWHDTATTPAVAVVNETFARMMWRETPALGQRFIVFDHLTEVVGVVQDGKYHDIRELPQPAVYLPLTQSAQSATELIVRGWRTPGEMAVALQRTLNSLAPNVPITVQSWEDSLSGELLPARAAMVALGVMGMLAAMLAVIGIFGMAAYSVSRRMKELGIRVALGARKTHVMSAALGRPMLLLAVGSVVGLLAGVSANRLLEQVVFQANPREPVVVGGAVLTMVLLGMAAAALPARRALAVDPSKLMREE